MESTKLKYLVWLIKSALAPSLGKNPKNAELVEMAGIERTPHHQQPQTILNQVFTLIFCLSIPDGSSPFLEQILPLFGASGNRKIAPPFRPIGNTQTLKHQHPRIAARIACAESRQTTFPLAHLPQKKYSV